MDGWLIWNSTKKDTDSKEKTKLSNQQILKLKRLFDSFDLDGDGLATKTELATAMRSLGKNPTEAEVQDELDIMDADGDGVVDFPEYLKFIMMAWKTTQEGYKKAFKMFDKDGNGHISAEDLKQVMASFGEIATDTVVDGMIRKNDVDGDGQISYDEFVKMMMQLSK